MKFSLIFTRFFIFIFWFCVVGSLLILPRLSYFGTKKSITIFSWPLLLDPVYLKTFEKETGIKIYITYFENGAAMLAKMDATGGYGYDLVIPDDHYLDLLIQKGLLKKIDKSRLTFWNNLHQGLLNRFYDPENRYSIPYYWGVYGIGYNKKFFPNGITQSWNVLFNKTICPQGRICMTDDPREAILLTTQFLYGTIDVLVKKEVQERVKQALITQKKNVEIYTSARADDLLQMGSCAVASMMGPELYRVAKNNPSMDFFIPREGSFLVIDSIGIPKASNKDDLIYTFSNFLYKTQTIAHHQRNFGFCSPIQQNENENERFCPIDKIHTFNFFKNVISDEQFNEIWLEVLAA